MYLATVVLHPSAELVAILVGIVLPLINGLIVKDTASSFTRAVTNAVLVVIAGLIAGLAVNPTIDLYSVLFSIALAFVSSGASYEHLWKPTGVTTAVQSLTGGFGIGATPASRSGVADQATSPTHESRSEASASAKRASKKR